MVKNNNKPVKSKKKVKLPDEQTESPGTPMGNFQGHNVSEYAQKGSEGKPLSFNDAEPKLRDPRKLKG